MKPSSTSSGSTVLDLKPVGLAGSGGSTPLRLRVAGDPDQYLFGKLYAMSHVRADRWYKMGRTVLYGRLEDEAPFQSVRRLVEYEDYALRLVRDAGVHTAAAYGIVEMTPEREYLLVTEFFNGAKEIGDVEVDESLIDQGLLVVRRLWDGGLAHRDIKPANLMVLDGELLLIDLAFTQVRPSPCLRQLNRGRHVLGPRLLAVLLDGHLKAAHRARHARRPPSFNAVLGQLALGIEVHVARGLGRRHLTEIDERRTAIGEPDQHEAAAAEIARKRVCCRHGEAHRDGGIDGVAALLQHRDAYVSRLRFHRDRHAVSGAHGLARRIGLHGGGDEQARERGNNGSSHRHIL